MAQPGILTVDTILYSPMEPEGRLFFQGEPWPGDVWSARPGGDPVLAATTAGVLDDLNTANDQIEQLRGRLASQANDLSVMAAERDGANGKVADLEQRAIEAERSQVAAEDAGAGYMADRDSARAEAQRNGDDLTAARARIADLEVEAAKVPGLAADLDAANQTIADLNGKVADLEAAATAAAKPDKAPKATDA